MIQKFVARFMAKKGELKNIFLQKHPKNYENIVKSVISLITSKDDYAELNPDPERIHVINDGDYQGTLVFVIGAKGYQPSKYWYAKICYGSCSGCDTLERIKDCSSDNPTSEQVNDYLTLALHIVQGIKLMGDEE